MIQSKKVCRLHKVTLLAIPSSLASACNARIPNCTPRDASIVDLARATLGAARTAGGVCLRMLARRVSVDWQLLLYLLLCFLREKKVKRRAYARASPPAICRVFSSISARCLCVAFFFILLI